MAETDKDFVERVKNTKLMRVLPADWYRLFAIAENVTRLRARVEELEGAHKAIMELPGEINTANYTHDDVVALNNAFCEAFHISSAALSASQPAPEKERE